MQTDDIVRIAQSYNNLGSTYINLFTKKHNENDFFETEEGSADKRQLDTAMMYLKESLRLKRTFTEEQTSKGNRVLGVGNARNKQILATYWVKHCPI